MKISSLIILAVLTNSLFISQMLKDYVRIERELEKRLGQKGALFLSGRMIPHDDNPWYGIDLEAWINWLKVSKQKRFLKAS